MLTKIAVLSLSLLLLPVAEAAAAQKQQKVNCTEQARANCPNYGTSGQACFRAAFARCKQGK